jgi:RNase P/RNase MRP subunit p29
MTFKFGDRVEVVNDFDDAKVGMTGKIIFNDNHGLLGVEFDKSFKGGHSCGGRCKDGYGHWAGVDHLRLIETKRPNIGDRIKVVKSYYDAKVGMTGTVINIKNDIYAVRFDESFVGGHDCGRCCESGYGQFVHLDNLIKIESEKKEFKIGDKVKVICNYCNSKTGMIGNIVTKNGESYGIRFDKEFEAGHDCNGHCESGRGQYISAKFLVRVDELGNEINFNIGDRVMVKKEYDSAKVSTTGTITAFRTCYCSRKLQAAVQFDKIFDGGHDCDGHCKDGYGQYIELNYLTKINKEEEGMEGFKVGQMVRLIKEYDKIPAGTVGEVVDIKPNGYIGLKFNVKNIRPYAHDCNGHCKEGYGWYINKDFLQLANETFVLGNVTYVMTEKRADGSLIFVPSVEVEYDVRFDDKFKADKVVWDKAAGTTKIYYTSAFDKSKPPTTFTQIARVKDGDIFDKKKGFEVCCLKARIKICQDRLSRY